MKKSMRWDRFFTRGTPVIALPDWNEPRLFVPAQNFWQRWKGSSLCPPPSAKPDAIALPPKLGRLLYRIQVALGQSPMQIACRKKSGSIDIQGFVREIFPEFSWAVFSVGVPGKAQKITAQLWNDRHQVIGYLKYSRKPIACDRIAREYAVLSQLQVQPRPLKFGPLSKGTALLIEPIPGKHISSGTLPPEPEILTLLDQYAIAKPVPLNEHPWVQSFQQTADPFALKWLDALGNRPWPIVALHGDFSPWNLLRSPNGKIFAIDWEYGLAEGFPYLDLAYYILQVAYWSLKWSPIQAFEYAVEFLSSRSGPNLTLAEAKAIVRLSAYQGYQFMLEDGHSLEEQPQYWRSKVWEHELCNLSN